MQRNNLRKITEIDEKLEILYQEELSMGQSREPNQEIHLLE